MTMMNINPAQRTAQALALELIQGKSAPRPAELANAVKEGGPVDQATFTASLIDNLNEMLPGPTTFISTPISGGPRLMEFLDKHNLKSLDGGVPKMPAEHQAAYEKEVIQANSKHATDLAAMLRAEGPTLESADIEGIPGFRQPDYNRNWVDVVENVKPIDRLVVCDGWQFSFGTLLEVRVALDRGLKVEDEVGAAINPSRVRSEVKDAMAEASRHGLDFSRLGLVMDEADVRQGPMSL